MKKYVAIILMSCMMMACVNTFAIAEEERIAQIENIVREAFEEDEWEYEYDEENKWFILPIELDGMLGNVDICIFVYEESLYVLGDTYVYADSEYFENVATFIALVNYELPYGKLCIAADDGWVTYDHAIYYGAAYPEKDEILNSVYNALFALDVYGSGISACAMGADPYKTLETCQEVIAAEQ